MPKAICARQSPRLLLPSTTCPFHQQQLVLPGTPISGALAHRSSPSAFQASHSCLALRPNAQVASSSARPTCPVGQDADQPTRSTPSISSTCQKACRSTQLLPASELLRKPRAPPPASPHDGFLGRLAAAARSTTAVVLATSVLLSAALSGPSGDTAAAAAATGLLTMQVAAPAGPSGPSPATAAALASSTAAGATALPDSSPPPGSSAPASAPVPAVRFTGPDALATLPPIPTEFPPLPELKLPPYTTAKLRNGLRVFLLRDEEVPLVRASLLMKGGQYGSPPDKVGLASLTAYVQRAGGSEAHPAASLDSRLEELAASIEFGAGPQAVSADMQCLAEDAEEVLGLLAELVRTPLLPADKLAVYQAQVLNALDHQNDSPAAVARRKITKLLYGPDSIYARTPTKTGVASISPADMRAYVAQWERPDAAVLGVVGSFEPPKMLALVQERFGDWAPAPGQPEQPPEVPQGPPPEVPPALAAAAAAGDAAQQGQASALASAAVSASVSGTVEGTPVAAAVAVAAGPAPSVTAAAAPAAPSGRRAVVYLVDRPGLTQANVLTAEPGISLSDPDVYALDVLGGVFNSFGGQLFDTLRSKEGLAYSVSGGWDSPPDHPGLFVAGGQTSSPGEFLRSLRQLLGRSAQAPPSQAELEAAKEETLNSFAFNFASTANQLQRILVYDLLGLPQNYLFRYIQGIERVEQRDVARAAGAHLHPERQVVVVVGDREVVQPGLEAAGFRVLPLRLED